MRLRARIQLVNYSAIATVAVCCAAMIVLFVRDFVWILAIAVAIIAAALVALRALDRTLQVRTLDRLRTALKERNVPELRALLADLEDLYRPPAELPAAIRLLQAEVSRLEAQKS